jgi:membrane protease YdiL (CAAX protease family)
MRDPDALDAARVLALGILVAAAASLLVWRGVHPVVAGAVQQIGFHVVPLIYARWSGLRTFASSGFVRLPLRSLAFVLMASLGSLWLLNGLVHLQKDVVRSAGYEKQAEEQERQIQRGIETAQKQGAGPALALLVLIPPLCEETFFRGILFRGILARFGAAVAIAATSILFALFHAMDIQKILMLILGCYFGFLVYITRSLWASIVAHGVNNLAVLTLMWIHQGNLPDIVGPWWMYVLSALVFGLAVTMLVLDRKEEAPQRH